MAETLTVDPTPTTEVVTEAEGVQLTAEESDSLKVGEQLQEQQEQLYAGKYKSAEELERAYGELQKKLGEKGDENSETAGDSKPTDSKEDSQETKETEEDFKGYLDDGSVNYETVNETYGEQLGNIFKNSNVDPWSISKHFHENNGTITDEMYTSLENAGLSRASIDSYLAGRAVESGYTQSEDLSDSEINQVKEFAGGEESYNQMVTWASQNLAENSIKAFDEVINMGSVEAIKLAVSGLKAQYENANGYEGKMLSGKAPTNTKDVYRSQAELVAAMNDKRYDNDPAYRQDVIAKLERSDNLTF
tara:strand:- start:138 stop:1052 length:915 start_codon:yes stop_codon:yes gene_type:complete